jgi:hypothetical protein
LVPALSGVVGTVVLPILGAIPDGMIVLFSGLGDDAQEQLAVGVGGKLTICFGFEAEFEFFRTICVL